VRGSSSERGYGTKWRHLRQRILRRDSHTCTCGQPANTVDHIVAKAAGGNDHPSNLRSLCEPCHNAKTLIDAANGRRDPNRGQGEAPTAAPRGPMGADVLGFPTIPDRPGAAPPAILVSDDPQRKAR
jgi:5-methylcytosine-specific restriction endonuclease McrA